MDADAALDPPVSDAVDERRREEQAAALAAVAAEAGSLSVELVGVAANVDDATARIAEQASTAEQLGTGAACGRSTEPFLLRTYPARHGRDVRPIWVRGRHWGGFRMGYRVRALAGSGPGASVQRRPLA